MREMMVSLCTDNQPSASASIYRMQFCRSGSDDNAEKQVMIAADDLLPLMCFILVQSNMQEPLAQCQFILDFMAEVPDRIFKPVASACNFVQTVVMSAQFSQLVAN